MCFLLALELGFLEFILIMVFGLKHLNRIADTSSSWIQTPCDFYEITKTYIYMLYLSKAILKCPFFQGLLCILFILSKNIYIKLLTFKRKNR